MKVQGMLALLAVSLLLAACSSVPVPPESANEDAAPVAVPKKRATTPPAKAAKAEPPPPVVILLSDDIPPYREVADALVASLQERAELVIMSRKGASEAILKQRLRRPGYQQYVAIGLPAAELLPTLLDEADLSLFCQLFNYHEVVAFSSRSKGVSAVPSADALFRVWRRLDPQLDSVGVITGPGLDQVIAQAKAESARHGVTLHHREVASDKEMLYAFKQLGPTIDGLWLLPDNRILSRSMLRELMSYGVRNAKQLAVFNDELLKFGGLISISADTGEIAAKLLQQLSQSRSGKGIPGAELLPLEAGVVHVNPVVAERFNLSIDDNLKAVLHAP